MIAAGSLVREHYEAVAAHRRAVLDLYAGEMLKPREMAGRRRGAVSWTHGYELRVRGDKAAGSSIGDDEIRLLYELAHLLEIRTAYTIGTAFGLSTFALALARPDATVYAIDDYSERAELAQPYTLPLVERIIRERCPNVRLHVGPSPSHAGIALSGLAEPLGLVFVDAMHTSPAAAADYRSTLPYVDESSVVLWHDADTVSAAYQACLCDPFDRQALLNSYGRMGIYWNSQARPEVGDYINAATWRLRP